MKRTFLFLIIGGLLLAACGAGQPEAETHTGDVYYVHISPALRPIWPAVQTCAAQQDGPVFVIRERFYDPADGADLYLHLGEPEPLPAFVAPLAWETIMVVVNSQNPVGEMSRRQVQDVFHAAVQNWSDLGGKGAIQVWVLLEADETRQHFESLVLAPMRITPNARLAPDAELLAQSVADDPAAIGYLPGAWLNENLKSVDVGIRQPVLVLADSQPQDAVRDLVVCLQDDVGQTAMPASYITLK